MNPRQSVRQQYPNLTALGVVTTPWGGPTAYEQAHPGVDIANRKGTPITSPVDGVVEKTITGQRNGDAGYGNVATIRDMRGDRHQLGHLDQVMARPGQRIRTGMPVGTMGNSGSAYSPSGRGDGTHLDYRIVSAYGKWKNPMTYVKNFNTYGSTA